VFEYYSFDSATTLFTSATLYVPAGTKAKYEATSAWNLFQNIVEMGDANGDKVVDVADVVAIVNCILGEPVDGFIAAAADINGDSIIDVVDVVAVVNIILGE
jgi:hypothetical protein